LQQRLGFGKDGAVMILLIREYAGVAELGGVECLMNCVSFIRHNCLLQNEDVQQFLIVRRDWIASFMICGGLVW
jgi:hypothetical protein